MYKTKYKLSDNIIAKYNSLSDENKKHLVSYLEHLIEHK